VSTPSRLGRYQLVEQLGQGGMGEVWIAKLSGERGFEKACLVKTVLPQLAKDRSFLERFEHEAKVLTMLQHSNIAQVYDMGEAEGRLYMALEYITGVDVSQLADAMRKEGLLLPVPVALFIGWQAAEGLGYAHRKTSLDGKKLDLVHRDVTPQNVMVSFEGEVKVIDFGIARSAARAQSTQTATVMGKLGYMSPEQALAKPLDARTDQYALAVVVWELLTGVAYISQGTTPAEIMQAMAYPKPRALLGRRADVDAPLDAALQKALAVNRDDRYPTTDEFARALLMQLSRLGGPPPKAQVGEFVRARCAAQFQTSQRLLSKVSTFARAAVPTEPMPMTTMLQPPPGVETIITGARPAALQSAPLPKLQRSKGPFIGAAVAVLVLAAGAFAYWKFNQPQPIAPPPVEPPLENVTQPVASADASVPPPKNAEPPKLVEAKKTAELFVENGETYARAGTGEGLKPGQVLSVLGPAVDTDVYPLLGQATVKQVFSGLTVMTLDASAAAVEGPRWVSLTPAKTHEDHVFKASVSVVNNSNGRVMKVENESSFAWSRCVFSIAGKQSFSLAALPAKASHGVAASQFKPDPHAPALKDAVEIRCAEGSARLPLK